MSKLTYRPRLKLEVFYTGGAVHLSRDGTLLACSCGDDVKVVETSTGAVVKTLAGDSEPVTALAFAPSGKELLSCSRSLQMHWWDLTSSRIKRSWKGHRAPVADVAVDASGGLVASGSADRSVRVWDTDGGFCTHVFNGHSGVVLKVMFHPKQLMVVSSGDDAEVRVWDLVDKSCVATLKGHYSAVTALALAPDGWTLVSGGRDKVALLWDLRTHTKLASLPLYESVEGLVALPVDAAFPGVHKANAKAGARGKAVYFATGGEKGRLKIWRSDTAQCVYEAPGPATAAAGGEIREVMLLPGGAGILVATGDCRLQFWKPQGAEESEAAGLALARQLIGNNDEITDIRFVGPPAAPTHLAVATNSDQIRLFDTAAFGCTASLAGHTDIVLCLDALPLQDGRTLLLSGAKDNSIRLWDATSATCLGHGDGHIAAVSAVAFSRRSPAFLISGGADKLLKVWDLASVLKSQAGAGSSASGPAELRVTAAVAAHDKDINAVAVSPNDALVCTASQDRTAKVWRLPSLVAALTLRGHRRGVWAAQFSPVDQCVATASGDRTVRLWGLADGACLKTFEGHTASVLRVSFLSAGTQLLSAGSDGLLKLWGVRSGECANTFEAAEDKVWALAVAGAQEELVATGGGDAALVLWEDCTAAEAADAAEAEQQLALRQQDLANALQARDYAAAAELAFDLKQPRRLLTVVTAAADQGPTEAEGILARLVAGFTAAQLKAALEYARDWNTNAKTCHTAHALLKAILLHHHPKELMAVPGVGELVEGLVSYSVRHYDRVDRLVRSAYLLDFTLDSMSVLQPLPQAGALPEIEDVVEAPGVAARGEAEAAEAPLAEEPAPSGRVADEGVANGHSREGRDSAVKGSVGMEGGALEGEAQGVDAPGSGKRRRVRQKGLKDMLGTQLPADPLQTRSGRKRQPR